MMLFFSRVLGLDTVIDINMKSKHPGTVLVSEGRMKQVMNSQTDRCCGEQNMKAKLLIYGPGYNHSFTYDH